MLVAPTIFAWMHRLATGTMPGRVTLAGLVFLVVEDEPLVALDIATILTASGASVVAASRLAEAITALDRRKITGAILDIRLGGEDCSALCQHLWERGIPFLFHTGYNVAPDGWNGVPMIAKPASREQIIDAVVRLCGSSQRAVAGGP